MRKLTVTIKPNIVTKKLFGSVFKNIHSIALKEILRIDFIKGQKMAVVDILVKDGVDFDNISFGKRAEILDVLEKKGNTYTCLVKGSAPKGQLKILQKFNFDLIYDIPTITTYDKLTYSVIGEEKNLKKFLTLTKLFGKQEGVVYKKADYRGIGLAKNLTEKQNNILNKAVEFGYYKYPREISADELAKRIGVSKSTLTEHLRKAENSVMNGLFIK